MLKEGDRVRVVISKSTLENQPDDRIKYEGNFQKYSELNGEEGTVIDKLGKDCYNVDLDNDSCSWRIGTDHLEKISKLEKEVRRIFHDRI